MLAACSLFLLLTLEAHGFLAPHTKSVEANNVVEDALRQSNQKLRCFERAADGRIRLSEPKFILCSFMIDPTGGVDGLVNGVDSEEQDYENVLGMMTESETQRSALLQVCLTEAFQFHDPSRPSQVATRCLCKRSGCNLPKSIGELFEYQKYVLPTVV